MRIPKSQLQVARGKKIYQRYLSKTARQPVTVSQAALHYTESYIEKNSSSPRMFQKAMDEVYHLMKEMVFPSFAMSDKCSKMIQLINTEKKQKTEKEEEVKEVKEVVLYINIIRKKH